MAKKSVNVENQSVAFSFDDAGEASIILSDLSADIITQLALHGLSQKVGDSYAGAKGAVENLDVTADEWSLAQAEETIKQLVEGNWAVRSGGGAARVTDLASALAEASGAPVEDMVSKLAEASKEEKAALRKHPQVALILARFKEERAAAKKEEMEKAAAEAPSLSDLLG